MLSATLDYQRFEFRLEKLMLGSLNKASSCLQCRFQGVARYTT